MNKTVTIKQNEFELLFVGTFGCSFETIREQKVENDEKGAIRWLAQRAYRDFNRTMRFKKDNLCSEEEELKENFSEECELSWVCDYCRDLIKSNSENFSVEHDKKCQELADNINTKFQDILKEDFTFGQAQKWINMTIKYMLLTGIWDDELPEGFEKYVDIPVDSLILQAAADTSISGLDRVIEVYVKHDYNEEDLQKMSPYREYKSQPWSKWNMIDYRHFIDDIRKAVAESQKFKSLYEWENFIWPIMAASK
ncbi:MAG: hypothetical protein ACI4ET_12565 [Bilifractor sp.]